jgi:hypothetical protein
MSKYLLGLLILFLSVSVFASEHGIYLKTHQAIQQDISAVEAQIFEVLKTNGFDILYRADVKTPDYVREDKTEHCGFKAKLIVFSSKQYLDILTKVENKYLIGGFLRVGIYEDTTGVNVSIIDPETISRIIFNDLYENDKEVEYKKIVESVMEFKKGLLSTLHSVKLGQEVSTPMEPIRDDEDLAESSKDMFMMVGQMTFFNDEDQFPKVYSSKKSIADTKAMFKSNLKKFKPVVDDIEYRWTPNTTEDLQWKIISEVIAPNGKGLLLGFTRPRTEGVSFNIAGASREDETNMCPGIDHAASYPIEVLLLEEDGKVNVYTQRQMFRMDMYFWDAGMAAFMDHMSMPAILDESLQRAILAAIQREL